MGIMTVDKFFKLGIMSRDSHDTTNKTNRRSIRPLSLDEASDMFGISWKDDLDLRKRIFEKYKEKE
jgi:hypothetical protein